MSFHLFLSFLSLSLCLFLTTEAAKSFGFREGSAIVEHTESGRKIHFVPSREPSIRLKAAATATFNDVYEKTGWGVLKVQSNRLASDTDQYYSAGYLECSFTAEYIYDAYLNMYDYFFGNETPSTELIQWLNDQDSWTRQQISGDYSNLSNYWKQVALLVEQFDGCRDGYKDSGLPDIGLFGIQLVNDMGDLLDLEAALNVNSKRRVDWTKLSPQEFREYVLNTGHCSAIVKLTGDLSNLYSAHSSWFTYGAMLRIYKHYDFPTNHTVASRRISFSSYPGCLSSLDDFYMMESGLVMLQTTNNIFNTSLYKLVTPQSLLAWQRVRLANALASTGQEWANYVSQHNSGTYNNQYMVINYNNWIPGRPLQDGLLWVVEQIPGYIHSGDQTTILGFGYWPSYNVPFYSDIYELSGYPDVVKVFGTDYSYDLAPRAKIFRRDETKVTDLQSLRDLMRYNDYLNDDYANGDPWAAICSRGDLDPTSPSAGGCYDTKVTVGPWVRNLHSEAINGPTTSNGLPPFVWNSKFDTSHAGQPAQFNYSFMTMEPDWSSY